MEKFQKYVFDNLRIVYERGSFPNKYENMDDFSLAYAKIDGEFRWVCKVFGVNVVGYGVDIDGAVNNFIHKLVKMYGSGKL